MTYADDSSAETLRVPTRALAIGAHPDDAEFGAGGTLASWTEQGAEAVILVVTDGSKGTWDHELEADDLAAVRRNEQVNAARVMGAAEPVMLGHPDGELEYSLALRAELCHWIRRLRPDVVLTHDPWRRYMLHPDHRVVGWAVIDAVVAARDHLFFPEQLTEGLTEHRPRALLLWAPEEADYWEDISGTVDRKADALLCHSSQGMSTMGIPRESPQHRAAFTDRIHKWAAQQGVAPGLAAAESFKMIVP
jgi:LmbE family N-acetylglucosaminyl deacetylase